jgi:CII-binding regulator of phage lambda lysogenization HflD
MKGLKTLIKIHKKASDELGNKIVICEAEKQKYLYSISDLEKNLKSEIELFGNLEEFTFSLGIYKDNINKKKEEYEKKIADLDIKIIDLRSELRVEFIALKKFETILKNRIKQIEYEQEKKAEAEASENAIMKYNYNNSQ